MKKVQILMSTYNGDKYLREQLDSIIKQNYSNFSILIRDDGSTDNTLSILEEYKNKYGNIISYYQGENIGVIKSFFDLMKNADNEASYYALSDQDDFWKINKIKRAVSEIQNIEIIRDIPILYCSRTTLVDKDLNKLPISIRRTKVKPSFGNALVENICTGCTAVINKKLLNIVINHTPNFTVMHDWWLYLTASYFGKVIFDEKSFILYRQHDNNVLGSRTNYLNEFKIRLKQFKKNKNLISKQAKEFKKLYKIKNNMNGKSLLFVSNYKYNIIYKINILFSKDIYRQRKLDNFIFKILFLFNLR